MKYRKALATMTVMAALGLSLAACAPESESKSSPKKSEVVESKDQPTAVPAEPADSKDDAEAAPAEPMTYTDPSEAQSYCEVFEALEVFTEEADGQQEEVSLAQVGERLRILERTATTLAGFTADETAQTQWKAMAADSGAAADFFESTGQQGINDDFIALIAKAYDSSSQAYKAQMEPVQADCGVDLNRFLIGPKE